MSEQQQTSEQQHSMLRSLGLGLVNGRLANIFGSVTTLAIFSASLGLVIGWFLR